MASQPGKQSIAHATNSQLHTAHFGASIIIASVYVVMMVVQCRTPAYFLPAETSGEYAMS